jgi:uncharacterized protein (TIGR04255 family)
MVMPIKTDSVILAIAEVRFNPILNLEKYIVLIQDELRTLGFPEFSHLQSQGFQLKDKLSDKPPTPVIQNIFQFSNFNVSSQFRLNPQCLTFQSSDYKNFESYCSTFMEGLFAVNKILQLAYIQRTGLRFIDRLIVKKGDRIQRYLAKPELALFQKLGGNSLYSYSEVKHQIDDVQLINRVKVFQNSGIEFPSDIDPGDMVFPKRLLTYQGPNAIIDTDAFTEKKGKLSTETLWTKLFELHDLINVAFEASVSELGKKITL